MTAVESDWHPLALLSSQERDEVVGTLPFPDTTHHYYLPETLPFPSDIVINYSQFFATIEPSVRDGNYVPPNELRNGDILQFSEYRQTSTFYVLWLTKNLTSYTRDNYEALLAQRSKYGGQYDYTQKQVSCSVLSTVVTSPSLPRDTLATPDTDQYDCYVFSHLDEYGYLGTSATSMGNEAYFRAIKPERMSEVLLDPLFLHSTSFHGRLLRYVKEKRHELRANPFFPSHYIAKLPSSRDKTSDVTSDHPEETVFDRLCEELEFIPIDLASEQLCSGFSVDRRNPFYLIRNILYLHCTHVLHLPTPDTSLPLINQKYHDCDDVTKFFISNCSSILLTSSPQFSEYVPSLHKLNGYQLYSDETTEELTRHLNPEADDYIDQYNAVVTSMTKRWRALDPDIVKIYEERAANSNVRREQANRDFALYRLFVVDQRVTSLTESEGSRYTSWLDLEKSLVQQWQETSAEVKAKYRSQHDALLVEKQLETDVEGVIRYIGILDSMDRVEAARATFPPPGCTQSLETPPSQTTATKRRVQDRVLPSAITFRDVKPSSGGGAFGVQASYRPLAGFVTFVLQQYEDKVQERNSVKFVREVVDGWKMLSEEEKEILIAEEKVIEENNKESYRQQQEERRKKNATSGFGGGFGAGFGAPSVGFGAPSVGFGVPAAPSVGFGAPAAPSVGFGAPSVGFGVPAAPSVGFGVPAAPSVGFGAPSVGFGVPAAPSVGFGAPSVGFGAPATPAVGFGAPSVGFGAPAAPAVGFKSENTDISISLLEEHTKEDSEA